MLKNILLTAQSIVLALLFYGAAQAWAQQTSLQQAYAQVSAINGEALQLAAQGQYHAAVKQAERALMLSEQYFGAAHEASLSCMNNLARVYELTGEYAKAQVLYQRSVETAEKNLGSGHPQTGIYLSNLALLHLTMGAPDKALPLAERALQIARKSKGDEHPDTAMVEHNLAGIYQVMGAYQKAVPLFQRAIANAEKNLGPEHTETANRLSNLAGVYRLMGEYEKALPLFQRALSITERALGPTHPELASMLSKFAAFYNSTGEYTKALALTQRILAIVEQVLGAEHPGTGAAMNNLAQLHVTFGAYDKALPLLKAALTISEKKQGLEHPDTAVRLSNLAGFYHTIGAFEQALPLSQRALAISEKINGANHPETGTLAANLGALYRGKGELGRALPLYLRALKITTAINAHHPDNAKRLNSLATLYVDLGAYELALPLYQRALAILEASVGGEHPDAILCLHNLAALYEKMAAYDKALPLLQQAFAASLFKADNSEILLQAAVADSLCSLQQSSNTAEAIFYCKLAVNIRQNLRIATKGLAPELQQNFVKNSENSYLLLNSLLNKARRYPEAGQVLLALKETEFRAFSSTQPTRNTQIDLTKKEAALNAALLDAAAKLHVKQQERAMLLNAKASQTELDKSERPILVAKKHLHQVFSDISNALQQLDPLGIRQFNLESDLFVRHLLNINAATQPEKNVIVAINALSTRTQISIYYDKEPTHLEQSFGMEKLQPKIAAMRAGILARSDAWRAPARELYQLLIAPLEAQLKEKKLAPHNLTLYISDQLRNLPLAALQDSNGEFLISKYRLSLYNPRFGSDALQEWRKDWDITAFGNSKGKPSENLAALPHVEDELFSIVRTDKKPQAALPGAIYLDSAFTRQTWGQSIAVGNASTKRRVLHVATHFQIDSNIYQSKLLMGDGNFYSADEIAAEPGLPLSQVDLVTLSACETLQRKNSEGAEFESLGALFQAKGASAVLGTLWAVADGSTAELMQQFYTARGEKRTMSKAAALQQAQIGLIRSGKWAHPYYWAGFVLMGKWL